MLAARTWITGRSCQSGALLSTLAIRYNGRMPHMTYRSHDTGETIHERDESTFATAMLTELNGKLYAIRRIEHGKMRRTSL
jgi:hypothetical protein